eukprot:TRINITY_DN4149_c0_g1_i2.p1 TRINITY_DN4149_c0_g1~~TRINITY_DN4149_c0_g1_i2.p1  ORF type:complete len:208 (-),score=20.65 TRINITY_DN4149_c0_g1_i2:183-806(-)
MEHNANPALEEWLPSVRIRIAGMSWWWKMFYFVVVWFPKAVLWQMTAQFGTAFLMETAAVDDIIVNSVALGFLLTMDELITETLMSQSTKKLLSMVQPEPIVDETLDHMDDHACVDRFWRNQQVSRKDFLWLLLEMLPWKLLVVFVLTGCYVLLYYLQHCNFSDGRWVSRTMFLPKSLTYSWLNALFPRLHSVDVESEPFWTYHTTA